MKKEERTFSSPDAKARVLVVDDEAHIRSSLVRGLSLMGYLVEAASSGPEALVLLERVPFDAMVVDIYMPGMDGVEVMQRARQSCPHLAIIVLTGRASLDSAIAAVKTAAEDYLLKPASVREIGGAVAKALQKHREQTSSQRRLQQLVQGLNQVLDAVGASRDESPGAAANQAGLEEPLLHVPPLTLDRARRLVIMGDNADHPISLTSGEVAVLASLMSRPNQVLSCHELACLAWRHNAIGRREETSIIRPYISRLRQKLEADPRQPLLLRNVRGRGYILAVSPPKE